MPFDIGEILYDDLQCERSGAYVFAEASQLRHPPLMPQKKMLHAVDGL